MCVLVVEGAVGRDPSTTVKAQDIANKFTKRVAGSRRCIAQQRTETSTSLRT
jgi:hypothetical protein